MAFKIGSKPTDIRPQPAPAARPPPPPPPPAAKSPGNSSAFVSPRDTALRQRALTTVGANEASSLRTEVLGDGRANCLENATRLAGPNDSIVLLNDGADGVGHALVRKPDGSIIDPNHPTVRYESLGQWQAMNPRYNNPVTVPAAQVRQVLSTPPGPARDALISQLGLSGIASRQVADTETRWMSINAAGARMRNEPGTVGTTVTQTLQSTSELLEVLDEREITEGNPAQTFTWYQVRTESGEVGWIREDLLHETEGPPPPRFPEWLENGTCPPNIPQQAWEHMPQAARDSIIRQERIRAVAESTPQPDWMAQGTRPPGINAQTWNHLPREDQQQIITEARAQWQAAVEQNAQFLFEGVPEGGVRVDEPFIGVGSTLGDGKVGAWASYAATGGTAAQYLNLEKMFGDGWPAGHYNLCGPLAVGAALGMGPYEALSLFKDKVSESVLKGGGTTDWNHLETMFEEAGLDASWFSSNGSGVPRPWQVAEMLAQGNQLVALVNIDDSGANGMLRPLGDSTDPVAHWVNIRGVEQGANGEWVVRVYNPFQNSEEVYSWEDFEAAWRSTAGNASNHGMVVANRPAAP